MFVSKLELLLILGRVDTRRIGELGKKFGSFLECWIIFNQIEVGTDNFILSFKKRLKDDCVINPLKHAQSLSHGDDLERFKLI